jgi:hypothetical protein
VGGCIDHIYDSIGQDSVDLIIEKIESHAKGLGATWDRRTDLCASGALNSFRLMARP